MTFSETGKVYLNPSDAIWDYANSEKNNHSVHSQINRTWKEHSDPSILEKSILVRKHFITVQKRQSKTN